MHINFYSSSTGRFLKPDNIIPDIKSPQSWNAYAYVNGNPVNFNDPTGHLYRAGRGQQSVDYAPWMGISETPELEDYLWGGSGVGVVGGNPGYTTSNLRSIFNTSSLTSDELNKFEGAFAILIQTIAGKATLEVIKSFGIAVIVESDPPSQRQGVTTMTVSKGIITGFKIELDFRSKLSPQKNVDTGLAGIRNKFVGLGGKKGYLFRLAELLGHETRHVEYKLTHPALALESHRMENTRTQSCKWYEVLRGMSENDAYDYEEKLNKELQTLYRGGP